MRGLEKNLQNGWAPTICFDTKWQGSSKNLKPRKAITFSRTQIFTKKLSSPKISCTPEGSETTENAQKWFSNALHSIERYHFVVINLPFDTASTICMTSILSLNKNVANECKSKHFPLLGQNLFQCRTYNMVHTWIWSKHTWMSTYVSQNGSWIFHHILTIW